MILRGYANNGRVGGDHTFSGHKIGSHAVDNYCVGGS